MTGPELKTARLKLGLTQDELAKMIGCTRQHIYHMEHHPQPPKMIVLAVKQIIQERAHEAA